MEAHFYLESRSSMRFLGFDITFRKAKSSVVNSTLANPEQWLLDALVGQAAAAGVKVTPLSVLGVPTVLACVNAVSRTVASVPLKLYRHLGNGGSEPAVDHPLYSLLESEAIPGEMTSVRFRRAVQANATLRNEAHALIVRNALGEVAELVPIEPKDILVEKNPLTKQIAYTLEGKPVPARSILTISGLTFNGVFGANPMVYAREAIALTIALQDNAARFFGNGSRPGAVLTHPGSLSEEAQDRLRKSVTAATTGNQANSLLVLEEGMKYDAARSVNKDSQFDESRARQDKAICRIFGVPQSKVGILDDAHYNNVEQENLNYVKDTILPWVTEWEASLRMKLLREDEKGTYFFKFNLEGLMRGDLASRYNSYAVGRNWGWLSVNDIRRLEDLNPVDDGDIYLQPTNMAEAGKPINAIPSTTSAPAGSQPTT